MAFGNWIDLGTYTRNTGETETDWIERALREAADTVSDDPFSKVGTFAGVYFPPGVYRINRTIEITNQHPLASMQIEGSGPKSTIIVFEHSEDLTENERVGVRFDPHRPDDRGGRKLTVRNLSFFGGGASPQEPTLDTNAHTFIETLGTFTFVILENLELRSLGCSSSGAAINIRTTKANVDSETFDVNDSHEGRILNCAFQDCLSPCISFNGGNSGNPVAWILEGNLFNACQKQMIRAVGISNLTVRNNISNGIPKNEKLPQFDSAGSIELDGADQAMIAENHFESVPNYLLVVNNSRRGGTKDDENYAGCSVVFKNNVVSGCGWQRPFHYLIALHLTDYAVLEGNSFIGWPSDMIPIYLYGPRVTRPGLTGYARETRVGRNFYRNDTGVRYSENVSSDILKLFHDTGTAPTVFA